MGKRFRIVKTGEKREQRGSKSQHEQSDVGERNAGIFPADSMGVNNTVRVKDASKMR